MLKRVRSSLTRTVLFAFIGVSSAQNQPSAAISGFTPAGAAAEAKLESQLKSAISTDRIRQYHRYFTSVPHPAGTKADYEVAHYIAEEWKKQGLEGVVIRQYDVLGTRPVSTSLEMIAPKKYTAVLREQSYEVDPDTKNLEVSSAWIGFSTSGDITASVVYAHSGNPEDYDLLRKNGISVKGKIVIVRYSNPYSYRGFKALTAEREGAAALLIYSDPAEDGYTRGKVFPDGPWGPASHIQRGAITYDYIVPGDPTTPGWASVPGAKRIRPEEARSLPKILAMPLSWRDAKPLLENMNGPEVPKEWRGALPITYRFTGAVKVHCHVDMDTSIKPYTVAEAWIRGRDLPDEWVLVGNHRDAWVYGGVDPGSGTASMLELTRSLGELKQRGIRPRRTIIVCSWDGEEYALTGSTEWGEQFGEELKKKLVAYLNVDEAVAGAATTAGPEGLSFEPSAVASLAPMLVEASKDVRAPSGKSLYEAWRATSKRDDKASAPPLDSGLVETRIGSGSDHTVFLNHLGRPVINLGFGGDYGVYHSMYDDHYWMEHIGDPAFEYHIALTNIWGLLALRLADADVLPYDFGFNGITLDHFLTELELRRKIDRRKVKLKKLHERLADFQNAGNELRETVEQRLASGAITAEKMRQLNQELLQVEANWLDPQGIPGRPWFQHLLYAARYTYAHLEFPGLTEAVEKGDWKLASDQAVLIQRALEKNIELLRKATISWEKNN